MKYYTQETVLAATILGMNEMLERRGFRRETGWDEEFYDRDVRSYWLRDGLWRRDAVDILYQPRNVRYVRPRLGVYLLVKGWPDKEIEFDGTAVGAVLDNLQAMRTSFPSTIMRVLFPKRFTRKLIQDTERALAWFDSYDTPQKCLDKLERGDTNCVAPSGPRGEAVRAHLLELIGRDTRESKQGRS